MILGILHLHPRPRPPVGPGPSPMPQAPPLWSPTKHLERLPLSPWLGKLQWAQGLLDWSQARCWLGCCRRCRRLMAILSFPLFVSTIPWAQRRKESMYRRLEQWCAERLQTYIQWNWKTYSGRKDGCHQNCSHPFCNYLATFCQD